ncbi:uncharacterized protein PV07_04541 [Cladophialophora immunda]|uniref:Uncharacterized protein n=1 Tax=Cladophialophora immunda TaxID=569365 RepID=A0A0D2DBH9_9EURO|nr:uncharacterized protein PV07_04541 [Cladophialophora immunda]KIW33039.1 hypothetical protein PV07_04541 [Cladophialophora immunda]
MRWTTRTTALEHVLFELDGHGQWVIEPAMVLGQLVTFGQQFGEPVPLAVAVKQHRYNAQRPEAFSGREGIVGEHAQETKQGVRQVIFRLGLESGVFLAGTNQPVQAVHDEIRGQAVVVELPAVGVVAEPVDIDFKVAGLLDDSRCRRQHGVGKVSRPLLARVIVVPQLAPAGGNRLSLRTPERAQDVWDGWLTAGPACLMHRRMLTDDAQIERHCFMTIYGP